MTSFIFKFVKRTFVLSLLMSGNILVHAQSIAKKGHECSSTIAIPEITCTNPDGGSDDIRFYSTEYQTCKNGNISELDHQMMGFIKYDNDKTQEIHILKDEQLSVEFFKNRVHIDDRSDDLTILVPKKITLIEGSTVIKIKITSEMQPDNNSPLAESHYVGSFSKTDINGDQLTSGRIFCFIHR